MEDNSDFFLNNIEDEPPPTALHGHSFSGAEQPLHEDRALHGSETRATRYKRSYVNDAVEVLRAAGRPLKLQELQNHIGARRGKHISLGSLKVCLSRYVDSADPSKQLARLAPGLFALSSWERMAGSIRRTEHRLLLADGRAAPDAALLKLFLWKLGPLPGIGFEQIVQVRALDKADAYSRLDGAGVPFAAMGEIEFVEPERPQ